MSRAFAFPPRLMKAAAAAHYLGISESKLRSSNVPRKTHGSNRLYDIQDLDAWADTLRYEEETIPSCHSEADAVFGLGVPG